MDDSTHVEPPAPTGTSDLAEVAGRVADLWRWAGQPTEDTLRSLIGARRAADGTVSDALPSGTLQRVLDAEPVGWEAVEPFVVACLRSGRRTQEQIALDLPIWRDAWRSASASASDATEASDATGAIDTGTGAPTVASAPSGADEADGADGAAAEPAAGVPVTGETPVVPGSVAAALDGAPQTTGAEDNSDEPTVVHARPVLPTVVQPAVPPQGFTPPPPPPAPQAPPVSLQDSLFGGFPEYPEPPPAAAGDGWASSNPTGAGRSRRMPVLVAAAVGAIALVAGGVAVAATRGGERTSGHSSAAVVTTSDPTVALPSGMALPAQGPTEATGTSAPPTSTTTPSGTTPTTTGGPTHPAGGGTGGGTAAQPGTTGATTPAGGSTSAAPAPKTSTAPPKTSAAPATSAAPSYPTRCTPSWSGHSCAGMAYFVAYGEHLYVCDKVPDGYAAVAEYTRTDVPGQNNVAWNKNGSGSCIDHNMNMPEGAKITFRVCLGRSDGTWFNCSAYLTTTS